MAVRLPFVACLIIVCLASAGSQHPVFAQSEIPVPPPSPSPPPSAQPLPHQSLLALLSAVQWLVGSNDLTEGQGTSLTRELNRAHDALNKGRASAALQRLETFKQHTYALVSSGVLGTADGQPLIAEAGRAQAQISEMAFGTGPARPASWSFTGCAERQPCSYSVVFVNRRAIVRGERDGTEERPFRTIAAALEHAANLDLCGVEIHLANGIYREDVVLTRHTTIDGQSRGGVLLIGAIVNNAGVDLTVRDLRVSAIDGPGGIFTDAPCAVTSITNVLVDRSARYGIYQRGGVLTVLSSIVQNTGADDDSMFAGTAMYLTGGVQAAIGLVEITDNASAGIVASGGQTRVYATSVSVTRTTVNPFFRAEADFFQDVPAAVDIRDGALLLMQFGTISRNELAGLRVRDGSQAHFRYGLIARTRDVPDFPDRGTSNAIAISDGTVLELSNFTITRGSLAGLFIDSAFASASDGVVSWNTIGVSIHGIPPPSDPDYDLDTGVQCLGNDVTYRQNDLDLDSNFLPVPCLFGQCPPPNCRRVAFVCPWCGN